jgi:hypothetical protein
MDGGLAEYDKAYAWCEHSARRLGGKGFSRR